MPLSTDNAPSLVHDSWKPPRPGERPKMVPFRVDRGFRVRINKGEGEFEMLGLQPSKNVDEPTIVKLEERFAIRMQQNNKGVILTGDEEAPARGSSAPSATDVGNVEGSDGGEGGDGETGSAESGSGRRRGKTGA